MTLPIALTLSLLVAAMGLFISGRLRPDLVALLVLMALAITGIITPQEAFSGFSRSAVITILAIYILTGGLYYTGMTRILGRSLLRLAGRGERRLVAMIMLAGAVLSLFMNNIAAGSVLLPAVMGISRQTQTRPSKLLIPLAYGTLLGGMATLLTTVNILASTALRDQGLAPFGLLSFAPVGGLIALAGVAYMATLGRRLLPDRGVAEQLKQLRRLRTDLAELYGLRENLFEVRVRPDSPLGGQRLADSGLGETLKLNVVAVIRDGARQLAPSPNTMLRPGDTLLVEGPSGIIGELTAHGLMLAQEPGGAAGDELTSDQVVLVEVALSPHADVIGKTLRDIRFRDKFGLSVLAIWREGHPIRVGLSETPLRFGDGLLVQGPRERIEVLRTEPDFIVLEETDVEGIRSGKAYVAALIMALALAPAAFNLLPVAEATLAGAVLMVLAGCLTMDEAYQSIEWPAIFLIAGMLPMGIAMTKTGTADWLSQALITPLASLGPLAMIAGLFLLTAGLTQVMSGAATVVVITPIALSAAAHVQASPYAFAMAVALAASTAFLTPIGHPVNVLVMGPGGYTFRDYFKVGLPLTVLTFIVVLLVLPVFWPLTR